jgi:hypothetical protein
MLLGFVVMEMGPGDESNGLGMPYGTITGKYVSYKCQGKYKYTHTKLSLDIGNTFLLAGRYYLSSSSR